jgi:hypothetical protein
MHLFEEFENKPYTKNVPLPLPNSLFTPHWAMMNTLLLVGKYFQVLDQVVVRKNP